MWEWTPVRVGSRARLSLWPAHRCTEGQSPPWPGGGDEVDREPAPWCDVQSPHKCTALWLCSHCPTSVVLACWQTSDSCQGWHEELSSPGGTLPPLVAGADCNLLATHKRTVYRLEHTSTFNPASPKTVKWKQVVWFYKLLCWGTHPLPCSV